jgi:predicted CXXCH cytochrome family protein
MIAAVAILLAIGVSTTSNAFHSGGVAECVGCHEMHGAAGASLLKGSDPSSTCMLNCHANSETVGSSYHVVNYPTPGAGIAPAEMTPGGDFAWLQKNYYFVVRGSLNTDLGQTHGHNIIAADFTGYTVDTTNPTSPGGSFVSANLSCISCHDQHGQTRMLPGYTYGLTGAPIVSSGSYQNSADPTTGQARGVYRLLRSAISQRNPAGATFPATPPLAVTNSSYNRSEFYFQTRTAYGSGMSEYCNACHAEMHSTTGILRHPTAQTVTGTLMGQYNSYVKSGDLTGSASSAYSSLVPFEEGVALSQTGLDQLQSHAQINDSQLGGMTATSAVMCVSCHRSHASGFPEMTRWNNEGEFMVYNGLYPGTDTTPTVPQFARGRSGAETAASYYNKPVTSFATYQRVLCNKCHAKD